MQGGTNFFAYGKVSAIVGGQFGSEAKGLIAAAIAEEFMRYYNGDDLVCITNAGAQAGHTTVLEGGRSFVCYHLPTAGVMAPTSRIFITAGSVIDLELMAREIRDVEAVMGYAPGSIARRVTVHPNAAVITSANKEREASTTLVHGSTAKGIGAAIADKVLRVGLTAKHSSLSPDFHAMGVTIGQMGRLSDNYVYLMEVPQGTGLSLNNSPFYPYCTSRDCWVGQALTDAGIHPSLLHKVAMVCRTFPIRVGNPPLPGGGSGYSGDFFEGSTELSWSDFPGIAPEVTTVTKRTRRIATWSSAQFEHAFNLNRPDRVYITFTNYATDHKLGLILKDVYEVAGKFGVVPEVFLSATPKVSGISKNMRLAKAIGYATSAGE